VNTNQSSKKSHLIVDGANDMSDTPEAVDPEAPAASAAEPINQATAGTPAQQPQQTTNYFDQFDKDEDSTWSKVAERRRLNSIDGYYRGTLLGHLDLERMKTINHLRHEGISDDNIVERIGLIPVAVSPGQTSEQINAAIKQWLDEQDTGFDTVIADLVHYDLMRGAGSAHELAAALVGQIEGGLQAPAELLIGAGIRTGAWGLRLLKAAAPHVGFRGALDTVAHNLIHAGVWEEFDSDRRAKSAAAAMLGGTPAGGKVPLPAPQEPAANVKPSAGQEPPGTDAFNRAPEQPGTTPAAPTEKVNPAPVTSNAEIDSIVGEVPYGGDDSPLSKMAIEYRLGNNISEGRNVAVFEYKVGEGNERSYIVRASTRETKHAERTIGAKLLSDPNFDPDKVVNIYSELQPCTLPFSECKKYIARHFPNARVTWSFEYGDTAESRAAGMEALRRAVRKLYQPELDLRR
jgi:hypothetical protein